MQIIVLPTGFRRFAVQKEVAMLKSIFVPLQGLPCDVEALTTAYHIARRFNAHLDCLHVRPDPRLLVIGTTAGMETGLGTGVFPADIWNTLVEADQRRLKAARAHFADACKKFSVSKDSPGVSASFRDIEGDPVRDLTTNARYCDLVVLASHSLIAETAWDARGDLIIGCGRPILLVPAKAGLESLSTIVMAWKDTAEAARAVTAAMPLLSKATNVIVLCAREGSAKVEDALRSAERLATVLRRHGLAAHAEHVPAQHKSVPEAIIDRAQALSADLLVMGAYGHSRVREFVFGGFTKHVLGESRLPALIVH
jgi:nucleotide-binding universal stress UspA family protein